LNGVFRLKTKTFLGFTPCSLSLSKTNIATGQKRFWLLGSLPRSWMGRVFNGIAEDEDTIRVLGIDVPRYKLAAFAMGTALAGMSGAFYTYHLTFIGAESFGFVESITVLSMVVFGGIGSVPSVIIAAALLSVLPAWFQVIGDYKLLVYGGLLFVMMRFSPGGMAGLAARFFPTSSLPIRGKP